MSYKSNPKPWPKKSAREYEAEIEKLEEQVADYEDSYRRVLSNDFAGDECHCSCVGPLRRRIAELEARDAD